MPYGLDPTKIVEILFNIFNLVYSDGATKSSKVNTVNLTSDVGSKIILEYGCRA